MACSTAQIQLTRAQIAALKAVAARRRLSMAAVVRDAVGRQPDTGQERRRLRALEAARRFRSGRRDVSRRHDAHLVEAFAR